MLLDQLTGHRVAAMQQELHDPLGMYNTMQPVADSTDPEGWVDSYWEICGGKLQNVSGMQAKYDVQVIGAGNVRTTLEDALRFADAVARGPIVAEAARAAWTSWSPASIDPKAGSAQGLGLSLHCADGHPFVGHTGGDVGGGAWGGDGRY